MNKTLRTWLIWIFAIIFTVMIAGYQRRTGPTYPMSVKKEIGQTLIKADLLRSYDGQDDAKVILNIPDTSIHAKIQFRKLKAMITGQLSRWPVKATRSWPISTSGYFRKSDVLYNTSRTTNRCC